MIRVLFILGTRPEAIKLAPIILHQKSRPEEFKVSVCVTGQHRQLLDQALASFRLVPDFDLNVMAPGQTLCSSSALILRGVEQTLAASTPDLAIVQGDTTTTMCGALAAFYRQIAVAHVEAGLRTGDLSQPFPEELNRLLTTRLAKLHFAPTTSAKDNLLREGCPQESVFVTGNSGIDSVLYVRDRLALGALKSTQKLPLDARKKLILVTAHRRESAGAGFEGVCAALRAIAARPDVEVVIPVHPNPHVWDVVRDQMNGLANVLLVEPLSYVDFVDVLSKAYLVLTDSGGVQEEAPSLGKPVLVLREKTERMEGVEAGTVKLVGTSRHKIFAETTELLDNRDAYQAMAWAHNPYGDGTASVRISNAILKHFEGDFEPMTDTETALGNLGRAVNGKPRVLATASAF